MGKKLDTIKKKGTNLTKTVPSYLLSSLLRHLKNHRNTYVISCGEGVIFGQKGKAMYTRRVLGEKIISCF